MTNEKYCNFQAKCNFLPLSDSANGFGKRVLLIVGLISNRRSANQNLNMLFVLMSANNAPAFLNYGYAFRYYPSKVTWGVYITALIIEQ